MKDHKSKSYINYENRDNCNFMNINIEIQKLIHKKLIHKLIYRYLN